ncbi:glycosyltransferase [Nonlabens sp. MIC269]|uniref:glycosyltransferase n=1 Tax=Nonlabens sp. MIC269 TaxID=1476901 RepID=UPI000761206E|nr:glycosyltransferase [Nonlabens sp. MIC269]
MKNKFLLYTPTLEGGGAEKVFIKLSSYLIENNYDVRLITAYGTAYQDIQNEHLTVIRMFNKKPSQSKLLNLLLRLCIMPFIICFELIRFKPHYFITAVLEANVFGNISHFICQSRSKLIIRQAGELANETHPGKLSILLKWAFNRSHLLIANSDGTKTSMINFHKAISSKIEVIGNPIYESKTVKTNNSAGERYLLAVGRLESQKDYPTLLKSFALIKDDLNVKLKIAGDGMLKDELIQLTNELKISDSVEFLGFLEDLDDYYANCIALVLSSHNEAFGNVIIEAMSYGKPVISTRCAGPEFIINNDSIGELCAIKNPRSMADSIIKVVNSPQNYDLDLIIKRAQDFSLERIGNKYLTAITAL